MCTASHRPIRCDYWRSAGSGGGNADVAVPRTAVLESPWASSEGHPWRTRAAAGYLDSRRPFSETWQLPDHAFPKGRSLPFDPGCQPLSGVNYFFRREVQLSPNIRPEQVKPSAGNMTNVSTMCHVEDLSFTCLRSGQWASGTCRWIQRQIMV